MPYDPTLMPSRGEEPAVELQHRAPEGSKANWFLAPQGKFAVAMRLYLPKARVLDRSRHIPEI